MRRVVCFASLMFALAASGCLFGGTFGENQGKKPERHLAPAEMRRASTAPPPPSATPTQPRKKRILRLDVYADPVYQHSVPRWKPRFRALVARANELIGPLLDLRLEVAVMSTWDRKANPADKDALLAELEQRDPGAKMVFVVGLVPSLPVAAMSFENLGAAYLGGRHMFLRNLDDLDEHAALESGWDDLSKEERDKIYLARKHHRELVVFLHELGHLLGVDHHNDERSIMYEGYRSKQSGFTSASLATMRGAIVDELAGKREDLAEREAAETLAEDRVKVSYALDNARRAKTPDDATPYLQEAEAVLAQHGDEVSDLWQELAEMYQARQEVTLAEQALARAGKSGTADTHRWVVRMRARFAIPPNAPALGLTPANEREYIESYNQVLSAISVDDYAKARRLTASARKRHGDLPGFDVLACDVAMRDQRFKEANRLCKRALARCETASWGHFLAGHLAIRAKHTADARAHFERAIALDPELLPARRALDDLGR